MALRRGYSGEASGCPLTLSIIYSYGGLLDHDDLCAPTMGRRAAGDQRGIAFPAEQ